MFNLKGDFMKVMLYLPIALLFSTDAYSMDAKPKVTHDYSETTMPMTPLKEYTQDEVPTVTLKAVASVILSTPTTAEQKKADIQTASLSTSTDLSTKTKKRGMITNAKYWWYGTPSMVIDEISKDKFDANQIVNRQLLYDALQEKAQVPSPENLNQVHAILDNCRAKNFPVDDLAVIELVRAFAHTTRTNEETILTTEAKQKLSQAEEKRTKVIANLNKIIAQSIEEIQTIDANLSKSLESVNENHEETILLGTNVKRLTRAVNKNIPADGYDSDPESKYDREFNARKLGLDVPTALNHKLNKRTTENLKKIKELVEQIDKKNFSTEEQTN